MTPGEYLKALRPALDGSAAMVLAVCALQWKLPFQSHWLRLVLEIGGGGLAYMGVITLLHRQRVGYFLSFAKRIRRPKLQAEAGVA